MEELSHAIALNSFGVARVTKAVLPAMRTARTGRVITVTSLNGVVALPFSDAYNAAKFAVEGLMESLATVMREFGVYISVLEPGPVRTAFFANVGGYVDNISNDDPYAELINRFNRRMAALGSGGQSAESVADVIREIAAEPSPARCVTRMITSAPSGNTSRVHSTTSPVRSMTAVAPRFLS
jgi:short-subunit dehydrogenase